MRTYRRGCRLLEREQAQRQREERELTYHHDECGMLVIKARLPPEEGALLLKALETIGEELRREETAPAQKEESDSQKEESDSQKEESDSPEVERNDSAEPSWKLEPTQLEPTQPEPTQPESTQSESTQPESTQSESTQPEPTQWEPTKSEPIQPGHSQSEPTQDLSTQAHPTACAELPKTTDRQRMADSLVELSSRALSAKAGNGNSDDKYLVTIHIDAEVLCDPGCRRPLRAGGRAKHRSGHREAAPSWRGHQAHGAWPRG